MNRARTSFSRQDSAADAVTDAVLTASRLLVAVSANSIAAVDDAITIPQFRLLVVLHTSGPMKLSDLADRLGVNPSTTTRMIDRLIIAGLVDRQVNPFSRREVVLNVTNTGEHTVLRVNDQRRRQIGDIVSRMPAQCRDQLVRALDAFTRAGGERPPAPAHEDWI
jgi:DNA-binding MarR family transcriptional regulator